MKKITNKDIGKLIALKFDDHVSGMTKPMECMVSGWIVRVEPDYIVLTWWLPLCEEVETIEHNCEFFTILRSTIKELKVV